MKNKYFFFLKVKHLRDDIPRGGASTKGRTTKRDRRGKPCVPIRKRKPLF